MGSEIRSPFGSLQFSAGTSRRAGVRWSALHHADEFEAISVSREKEALDNPPRALVAVKKQVITNNSVSICPSQYRSIGVGLYVARLRGRVGVKAESSAASSLTPAGRPCSASWPSGMDAPATTARSTAHLSSTNQNRCKDIKQSNHEDEDT